MEKKNIQFIKAHANPKSAFAFRLRRQLKAYSNEAGSSILEWLQIKYNDICDSPHELEISEQTASHFKIQLYFSVLKSTMHGTSIKLNDSFVSEFKILLRQLFINDYSSDLIRRYFDDEFSEFIFRLYFPNHGFLKSRLSERVNFLIDANDKKGIAGFSEIAMTFLYKLKVRYENNPSFDNFDIRLNPSSDGNTSHIDSREEIAYMGTGLLDSFLIDFLLDFLSGKTYLSRIILLSPKFFTVLIFGIFASYISHVHKTEVMSAVSTELVVNEVKHVELLFEMASFEKIIPEKKLLENKPIEKPISKPKSEDGIKSLHKDEKQREIKGKDQRKTPDNLLKRRNKRSKPGKKTKKVVEAGFNPRFEDTGKDKNGKYSIITSPKSANDFSNDNSIDSNRNNIGQKFREDQNTTDNVEYGAGSDIGSSVSKDRVPGNDKKDSNANTNDDITVPSKITVKAKPNKTVLIRNIISYSEIKKQRIFNVIKEKGYNGKSQCAAYDNGNRYVVYARGGEILIRGINVGLTEEATKRVLSQIHGGACAK